MTVTGLEGDLYYINNPILINITDLNVDINYIQLGLSNINDPLNTILSNKLRIYPNVNREIIGFDLSEVIKANFTRPKHPEIILGDAPIATNYILFKIKMIGISFNDGTELPYSSNKTFLRGGEDTQENNVTNIIGDDLKITDKHLSWGGLPFNKYFINSDKKIELAGLIPNDEIQQMNPIGCDPFYVRFLNNKGGYSFWYFPVWEKDKKTKSAGYVDRHRPLDSFSLGFEATHTVKAESKIRREHFAIAESLVSSPEIYVYNRYGNTWAKIDITKSSFSSNTYEDVTDFNANFDIKLSNDGRIIW